MRGYATSVDLSALAFETKLLHQLAMAKLDRVLERVTKTVPGEDSGLEIPEEEECLQHSQRKATYVIF